MLLQIRLVVETEELIRKPLRQIFSVIVCLFYWPRMNYIDFFLQTRKQKEAQLCRLTTRSTMLTR